MNLQTIKLNGHDFVLIPAPCYKAKKKQIDKLISDITKDDEYTPFAVEDYFDNPVTLARMKAGVTQYKLAKLMHVSQSYISQLEKNDKVSRAVIQKVKRALKDYPDRWAQMPK
jgi:uncharacterized protein YerC